MTDKQKQLSEQKAVKHTEECIEYAKQTRMPYCIAECADSRAKLLNSSSNGR